MVLEFPTGSLVRVKNRQELEEFVRTWKYHDKLQPEQLDYAGASARVTDSGFYFGGDELYQLNGIPGTWNEECLEYVDEVLGDEG